MRLKTFGLAALMVLGAFAAKAQDYPARPITIVVPFAAGSGSDTAARIIGQRLGPKLGQNVLVENRVGATGMLASSAVAKAEPDGYTLLLATNSTHGSNPSLYRNVSYDPAADFAGIGKIGIFQYFLVVNKDIAPKTIQELVAFAHANPEKLSYGAGSSTSLIMAETFKTGTKTQILKVPYRSNPPAVTDLIAGRISMMFVDMSSAISFVRANELRALAVTSREKSAILPDLPTIRDTVLPGFEIESWTALFAPKATPKPILDKLNKALNEILADAEVKKRLADLGVEPQISTPAELDEFVNAEVKKWAGLVKAAGIEPE